jgi:site-specific recombinase XerD
MTDVVHLHIEHLTRARYSGSTLRERERVLRTLPGDPLALTRETTQAWWEARQTLPSGEQRSAASLSQEASHVRRFYRWAMQQGLTDRNPADGSPTSARSDQPPPPSPRATCTDSCRTHPTTCAVPSPSQQWPDSGPPR